MEGTKMKFYVQENGMRAELNYGELDISGNVDHGYRLFQRMVASIVRCSSSVVRRLLENQRIQVEDLLVNAEVDRNPKEANRFEKLSLHYTIKGHHLDPYRLYKNLAISRKNCSMIRTVENSIEIDETIETIELSS